MSLDGPRSRRWRSGVAPAALLALASASLGCGISLAGSEVLVADSADANVPPDAGADATLDAHATDAAPPDATLDPDAAPPSDGPEPDAAPLDAPIPRDTSGPCEGTAGSCGPPGACVSCATSPLGQTCVVLAGAQTCGCGGPGLPVDCPVGNACRTMQCEPACDGQHPCNGGCCSLAVNGTCVASCQGNAPCKVGVCP